jgi:hypothetical protein
MTKAAKIVVTALDVGQGSGTFVEIYTGTAITATALLDLGSERAKTEAGGPSVDYIAKKLNTMAKPRIDFFSLSHSDSDHINLVQDLLALFDKPGTKTPTKPILEVGQVIYGGPRVLYAKHSGTNVISDLEAYQPKGTTKPEPLPANNCSYSQPNPVFSISDVTFQLVVGNHIAGEPRTVKRRIGPKQWKTDSYSLNTYSMIFVVDFAGWQFVDTGDATGATIAQANYFIDLYKKTFPFVAMLTMPHHSSETTTFSLTRSKKRLAVGERVPDAAKKVIEAFSLSMSPKTIHASAEDVGSFCHPSAYTMSYFWDHVYKTSWYDDPALTGNQHLYNAYFTLDDGVKVAIEEMDPVTKKKVTRKEDLPFEDWWTFATQHSIFTNRYYVREATFEPDNDLTATYPPNPGKVTAIPASGATTSPPFAVAWAYTLDGTTALITIARIENRKTGTTDFVTTPVMALSKTGPAMPPPAAEPIIDTASAAPPQRTLAPRPPTHLDVPVPGGGIVPPARPLPRLRSLDA